MATIQIKRKTSSGTGPLTGSGTIKAGEPLIDLNGGNLYIAKADKTNNLSASDYIEFYSKGNMESVMDHKISAIGLKSAAKYDTGTTAGKIPVIGSDGKLKSCIIPQIAITDTFVVSSQAAMLSLSTAQIGDIAVRTDINKSFILTAETYTDISNWQELLTPTDKVISVNGKTGTVTISLSELGGVSTSTFNSHKNDSSHLTSTQKAILAAVYNTNINTAANSVNSVSSVGGVTGSSISGALRIYSVIDSSYGVPIKTYTIGIDSSKVLQPSSTIDGGTF